MSPFEISRLLYTMRPPVEIWQACNYFHKSLPWITVCQISYPLWQRALLKSQLRGRDNPVMEESRFYLLPNGIHILQSTPEKQNFMFH